MGIGLKKIFFTNEFDKKISKTQQLVKVYYI